MIITPKLLKVVVLYASGTAAQYWAIKYKSHIFAMSEKLRVTSLIKCLSSLEDSSLYYERLLGVVRIPLVVLRANGEVVKLETLMAARP